MQPAIVPILLFTICATALGIALMAAGLIFGPKRESAVKAMPYESGMDPIHDARRRFDIRFHLVAIAFLLFDVELLFLYPWAVASRHKENGIDSAIAEGLVTDRLLVYGEVMVFVALLAAGLVYIWRKGVLTWR